MKFNFGEVLRHTWKIGWNYKVLWLWQAMPGAAVIFILPSIFIFYPFFMRFAQDPEFQISVEPWMSVSLNSIGGLFVLSYVLMWRFAQLTTILGAIEIENGTMNISFSGLFRKGLPYVWRVIGLYFLYCSMWALISVIFNPVFMTIARNSPDTLNSLFAMLGIPISIVSLASVIVLELAQVAIVADNMRVFAAVSHAWKIFRHNLLNVVIITLIVYFGTYIPFGLLLMPLPFIVFMSILYLTRLSNPNIIFFTVFFVIIPLVIILPTFLFGISRTFLQSAWTVTYLRLGRNANLAINSEELSTEVGI